MVILLISFICFLLSKENMNDQFQFVCRQNKRFFNLDLSVGLKIHKAMFQHGFKSIKLIASCSLKVRLGGGGCRLSDLSISLVFSLSGFNVHPLVIGLPLWGEVNFFLFLQTSLLNQSLTACLCSKFYISYF